MYIYIYISVHSTIKNLFVTFNKHVFLIISSISLRKFYFAKKMIRINESRVARSSRERERPDRRRARLWVFDLYGPLGGVQWCSPYDVCINKYWTVSWNRRKMTSPQARCCSAMTRSIDSRDVAGVSNTIIEHVVGLRTTAPREKRKPTTTISRYPPK